MGKRSSLSPTTHMHAHTLTHTLTHSHTHSHTHTHTLTHSLTRTHTHARARARARNGSPQPMCSLTHVQCTNLHSFTFFLHGADNSNKSHHLQLDFKIRTATNNTQHTCPCQNTPELNNTCYKNVYFAKHTCESGREMLQVPRFLPRDMATTNGQSCQPFGEADGCV